MKYCPQMTRLRGNPANRGSIRYRPAPAQDAPMPGIPLMAGVYTLRMADGGGYASRRGYGKIASA